MDSTRKLHKLIFNHRTERINARILIESELIPKWSVTKMNRYGDKSASEVNNSQNF